MYGYKAKWLHDTNGQLNVSYEKIESHKWEDKEIPSGFFDQPDSENVSAVLFSNSATPNKFNRMGKLAGFGDPKVKMTRVGTYYNPDPNASKPLEFKVRVEEGEYHEYWSQGLELFHNPNALHPIEPGLFSEVAEHVFEDNLLKSNMPDFFPMQSVTFITVEDN